MKEYEDLKYAEWRDHVEQVLPGFLKRNLLVKPPAVVETLALANSPHPPKPPSEDKPRSASTRRSGGRLCAHVVHDVSGSVVYGTMI